MSAILPLLLVIGLSPPARGDYRASAQQLEKTRAELATAHTRARGETRREVLLLARETLLTTITDDLIMAWLGTPWEFYGTSEEPGRGEIACGYLVSTVLRDAGFRVARVSLAQQAAEHIILTMKPKRVWRFRSGRVAEVLNQVARAGDGVYLVGLDYHVGFLVRRHQQTSFCHSSYLPPGHVVCRPAQEDPAMESGYHVVAPLLDVGQVEGWLTGRSLPTVTSRRRLP